MPHFYFIHQKITPVSNNKVSYVTCTYIINAVTGNTGNSLRNKFQKLK